MGWVVQTHMHDVKVWQWWVFLTYLPQYYKQHIIHWHRKANGAAMHLRGSGVPCFRYTHNVHTMRRSRPNLFYCSLCVSSPLFFPSAIGLVFKRTVEFHVRHRATMSAIFLTNTYLFCNLCINYLMNHVTSRGMGYLSLHARGTILNPTLQSPSSNLKLFVENETIT